MPDELDDVFMIAPGADAVDDLLPLDQLDPPLFADYIDDPAFEWYDDAGQQRAGDYSLQPIGRPYIEIMLGAQTREEHAYWRDTICGGARSAPVTVRCLNKTANEFFNFNGQIEVTEQPTWQDGAWRDAKYTVRRLKVIAE